MRMFVFIKLNMLKNLLKMSFNEKKHSETLKIVVIT